MEIVAFLIIISVLIVVAVVAANAFNQSDGPAVQPDDEFGSSKFVGNRKTETGRPGILLGYTEDGNDIVYGGEGHLLTVGHTRAGKGVGAIIPNLLEYQGSVIIFDPKGENAKASIEQRKKNGQNCLVFDPWDVTGLNNLSYNPLEISDNKSGNAQDDARIIAEAIIPKNSNPGQGFWEDEGRSLLHTLCHYEMVNKNKKSSNLGSVRRHVSDEVTLLTLLEKISELSIENGSIANGAKQFLDKAPAERSGVLSTIRQHTAFLDSPHVQSALSASNFRFEAVLKEPTTVYIVLPVWRIPAYGRLIRILVALALTELSRNNSDDKTPTLFIIDEFASLGRLSSFDILFSLLAGYGVQVWPVLQDMSQLVEMYPDNWESFVANAAVFQSLGTRDRLTAEYISNRLGGRTIAVDGRSETKGYGVDSKTESSNLSRRRLLYPDEVTRLPPDQGILFVEESLPIRFQKIRYYADKRFVGD